MTVKKKMLLLAPITVILIITFPLSSCNNWPNPKALRDLYNKTTYDTTIIHHLALYDSLKDILIPIFTQSLNSEMPGHLFTREANRIAAGQPMSITIFTYFPWKGIRVPKHLKITLVQKHCLPLSTPQLSIVLKPWKESDWKCHDLDWQAPSKYIYQKASLMKIHRHPFGIHSVGKG